METTFVGMVLGTDVSHLMYRSKRSFKKDLFFKQRTNPKKN